MTEKLKFGDLLERYNLDPNSEIFFEEVRTDDKTQLILNLPHQNTSSDKLTSMNIKEKLSRFQELTSQSHQHFAEAGLDEEQILHDINETTKGFMKRFYARRK